MFSSRHSLNILFLFIFNLLTSQSFSETISFKGLVLSNFWIKNVIANSKTTSGYIKIENKNEKNERLISVESNFSKRTELHYMNIKNDIMIMKHLEDGVLIKSKSKINLKPRSFHIMFIDLTKSLKKQNYKKLNLILKMQGQ